MVIWAIAFYFINQISSLEHVLKYALITYQLGFQTDFCSTKHQVKAKHMDRRNFKEAELSNPNKDQALKSGGSEGEDIPRVGDN